ncbi:MAG TPA: protein kinase, partial [Gemmataceae bacterium]|nr:protein kinase [Gemmataceae bacterium]
MSAKPRTTVSERVVDDATLDSPDQWLPDCVKEMLQNAAAAAPHSGGAESDKTAQVTAAYEEFSRRLEAGDAMDADDFCRQFPHLYSSLAGMIRCHSFLAKEELLKIANEQKLFPKPGDVFLGFKLTKVLGRGGFARVYLANEQALGNRVVVVKISKGGDAEADTLGPINHPNIVPVHSVQVDPVSGLTAVCMPYFGSDTLYNILDCLHVVDAAPCEVQSAPAAEATRQNKPPVQEAAYIDNIRKIGIQLADALHFIHQRGIFHLDLKPSNVLLTADTRPMLLDFNLSNDARAEGSRVGGTLPYMSPEQLLATDCEPMPDSTMLDARSDLYSLGVMLYEMLTGKHPYDPLSLNVKPDDLRVELLAKQRRGIVPIRRLNPLVNPKLARVVESCLAYNPEDRPGSASDLVMALLKAQSTWRVARRWLGSHRWLTVAAACVVLAFAGTAAAWSSLHEPDQERRLRLAETALARQDYKEAIKQYTAMLDNEPHRFDILMARAGAQMRLGGSDRYYYTAALFDFGLMESLKPCAEVYVARGYCQLLMHAPLDRAIQDFEKALQHGYETPEIHTNLGYCHLQLDQHVKAEEHLGRALILNRKLPAALHNRAMLRLSKVVADIGVVAPFRQEPPLADAEKYHEQGLALLQEARNDMLDARKHGGASLEWYTNAARIWGMAAAYDSVYTDDAFKYMT